MLLQLTTRTFSYGGTEVLLPVVDMANHQVCVCVEHSLPPALSCLAFPLFTGLPSRRHIPCPAVHFCPLPLARSLLSVPCPFVIAWFFLPCSCRGPPTHPPACRAVLCCALPFSPGFCLFALPWLFVLFLRPTPSRQNDCQHTHRVEPCDPKKAAKQRKKGLAAPALPPSFAKGVSSSSSSGTAKGGGGVSGVCITWRAETALAAGEEVCNCYGLLMQDHALLQYGFLQVREFEIVEIVGGGGAGGGWC